MIQPLFYNIEMLAVTRVIKNSTFLTVSVFLERAVNFILPLYLANIIGEELWGRYNTALSVVTIGVILAPWGLLNLMPRSIAREKDERAALISGGLWLTLFGIGLSIPFCLIFLSLLNYDSFTTSLAMIGIALIILPQALSTFFESVFIGLEQTGHIVYTRLPLAIARVGLSILLIELGYSIHVLFVILGCYHLLNIIAFWFVLRRLVPDLRFQFNRAIIAQLFIGGFPFFFTVLDSAIVLQVDKIFISKLRDEASVGIYSTGMLLITLFYMLAPPLMSAIYPPLSRAFSASAERFELVVNQIIVFIILIFFPAFLGTYALAEFVINLVFPGYQASIIILQLGALGILPSFLSRFFYRATTAGNQEQRVIGVAVVGSITVIGLSFLLIPPYGNIGAITALNLSIMVRLAYNLFNLSKSTQVYWWRSLIKPLGCGVISFIGFLAISSVVPNPFLSLTGGLAVFAGAILLTRSVDIEGIQSLLKQ